MDLISQVLPYVHRKCLVRVKVQDKLMSASCSARLIQLVKHFTNVNKFKFYDGRWFMTTAASLLLS